MAGSQWCLFQTTRVVNQARPVKRGGQSKTLWELIALAGWTNPQMATRYIKITRAAGKE